MPAREDIAIRFGNPERAVRTAAISIEDRHLLDVDLDEDSKIVAITLVDSYEVLRSAPAMGTAGAYHLVHDVNKDVLCIEFRREVASRIQTLRLETVSIDDEPKFELLFDPEDDLEGILIRRLSEAIAGELSVGKKKSRWANLRHRRQD